MHLKIEAHYYDCMTNRYRLQYLDERKNALSIKFAHYKVGEIPGACYRVNAIKESTDVDRYNKNNFPIKNYTKPMTFEEAREYLAQNPELFGSQRFLCVGLTLEDACGKIDFDVPIQIRNRL